MASLTPPVILMCLPNPNQKRETSVAQKNIRVWKASSSFLCIIKSARFLQGAGLIFVELWNVRLTVRLDSQSLT